MYVRVATLIVTSFDANHDALRVIYLYEEIPVMGSQNRFHPPEFGPSRQNFGMEGGHSIKK